MLLVAVDGFVLAVLLLMAYFVFPSKQAEEIAGQIAQYGVTGSSQERLLYPALGTFKRLAIRLSPSGATSTVQKRLDRAGNPPAWPVERVFAVKGLLLLLLGLLGLVFGVRSGGLLIVLCPLLSGAVGFFLPDLLIYNTGIKRQQKIQKELPDTLDLLSVSMKAGLGFDAAVARVAETGSGELPAEFSRMLQEIRLGKSRSEALRAVSERSTVTDLHHVVSSLIQADTLGIPVAKVLSQQAKEMRVRKRQRAEERAQKITVKIIFPTLFCIFPALFIVIIGPGAIRMAQTLFGAGGAFG